METYILGDELRFFRQLREAMDKGSAFESAEWSPSVLGALRGELSRDSDGIKKGDMIVIVVGVNVANELAYAAVNDFHPAHPHFAAQPNVQISQGHIGKSMGFNVIGEYDGILPADVFLILLRRDDEFISVVGRRMIPYSQSPEVITLTSGLLRTSLSDLYTLPDPMFSDNYDVGSIRAESDIARIIGENVAKHPQFLALVKLEVYLTADPIDHAHELQLTFHDLDFDQKQLDDRQLLMSSAFSQLVIRQFKGDGTVTRYLVLDDLIPKSVKITLNTAGGEVANRVCTWKFKSLKECKELNSAA